MIFRPVPGSIQIALSELSVLFRIIFLGTSVSLAQGWDLFTVAIYAFFAVAAAILVGLKIINLGLTNQPVLSEMGFILSGLGNVSAAPALDLKTNRQIRLVGVILLVAAALIILSRFSPPESPPEVFYLLKSIKI